MLADKVFVLCVKSFYGVRKSSIRPTMQLMFGFLLHMALGYYFVVRYFNKLFTKTLNTRFDDLNKE